MALIKCKECKKEVSKKAETCPHCGSPVKQKTGCGGLIGLVVIVFILVGIFANLADDSSPNNPPPVPEIPEKVESKPVDLAEVERSIEAEIVEEVSLTVEEISKDKKLWPNLIELLKDQTIPLVLDGEEVGSQTFEKGTKALVLSVSPDSTIKLDIKGSEITVPVSDTNLIDVIHEEVRLAKIAEIKERAVRKALEEQQAEEARLNAKRDAAIEANIKQQFSEWDGRHLGLARLIKYNVKDPDSFEHIESKWLTRDDHIIVFTKYRAKNSFGGYVIGNASAKYGFDGDLIEIISFE